MRRKQKETPRADSHGVSDFSPSSRPDSPHGVPPPIHDDQDLQDEQDEFDREQAKIPFEERMAKLHAFIRDGSTPAPQPAFFLKDKPTPSPKELEAFRTQYPALDEMMRLGIPVTRESYLRVIWPEPEDPPAVLDGELEASLPPPLRRNDALAEE